MMQESRRVTVADILCARDERAAKQAALLEKHAVPLVSFTMNIAGDIKTDTLIERAFLEGVRLINRQLERMRVHVDHFEQHIAFTGCEALWAAKSDASQLKERMCAIEETHELGRLFDIDVIDADGTHLSRGAERICLICGSPVRACARSRAHSGEELYQKARKIISEFFAQSYARKVGETAQRALLWEALTTPKPGLVDAENSGAHSDMDLFSFADSACALRSYFEKCVLLGMQNAELTRLQFEGMQAEDDMLRAARANTHKGAVFSLGILCYAVGNCGEGAEQEAVLQKTAEMGSGFLAQMQKAAQSTTGGEQQYQLYGLTGARGEAASGYASVTHTALPALRKALEDGKPLQEAGLHALTTLMAQVKDSNIIRRVGMEGQQWVTQQAQKLLEEGVTIPKLRELDRLFIERGISPGGSADLLAVTYFLHFWQQGGKNA